MKEVANNGFILKYFKIFIAIIFSLYFILYLKINFYKHNSFILNIPLKELIYILHLTIITLIKLLYSSAYNIFTFFNYPKLIVAISGVMFQLIAPLLLALYFKLKNNYFLFFIFLFTFAISLDTLSWGISILEESSVNSIKGTIFSNEMLKSLNYLFIQLNIYKYENIISLFLEIFSQILMFIATIGIIVSSFN